MPPDANAFDPLRARKELAAYLNTFPAGIVQRSRDLRVIESSGGGGIGAKHAIRGRVQGPAAVTYKPELILGHDGWGGSCNCAISHRCQHMLALGLKWLGAPAPAGASAPPTSSLSPSTPATPAPSAKPTPPATAPARQPTFTEQWKPTLEERIGRGLTAAEGTLLSKLESLFAVLKRHGRLTRINLHEHGFSTTAAPSLRDSQLDAFDNSWSSTSPPATPWALWQYIALSWQRAGKPIPEALLSETDTTSLQAALEHKETERDLSAWRESLQRLASQADASPAPLASQATELTKSADFRLFISPDAKAALEILHPGPAPAWKPVTQKWLLALEVAGQRDFAHLPPAARHLALTLRLSSRSGLNAHILETYGLDPDLLATLFADPACHPAITLPNGQPFQIEAVPLGFVALPDPTRPARLQLTLALPDGTATSKPPPLITQRPSPLYLWQNRVWAGPPPVPAKPLPIAAFSDPVLAASLRKLGVVAPANLDLSFKTVVLRPRLRARLEPVAGSSASVLHVTLFARASHPPCTQEWHGHHGWRWTAEGHPPAPAPDAPRLFFDLNHATAVGARFDQFALNWSDGHQAWVRPVHDSFPEAFIAWHALFPPDLDFEISPDLQSLFRAPVRARLSLTATPVPGSAQDWFDLHLEFRAEDLTLTPDELSLLLQARGRWVRLPSRGWQRLQVEENPGTVAHLARLGLPPEEELIPGKRTTYRLHALQLAEVTLDDEALAAGLRARAAELRALPPPPLPAGLSATLRPYQLEGYHFLAHLAAQGLGGVLADDMGLGKTIQTLTWLLHLSAGRDDLRVVRRDQPLRVLVVCPKSVVPNWRNEAVRFAPSLPVAVISPSDPADTLPSAALLILNYAQLRLRADILAVAPWDAVILDEGQNIKNPASATARAACSLLARHRLVLTGTPIENRLLDLWSLLNFAQPGVLGTQTSFQRLYNDKADPTARARLAARVRPFLLRRTKGQVAQDLPARIEEEISCEMEGPQRALYDAELKRARQLLLAVKTARELDDQRFNILQSLLRLRQICCDPRLLGLDSAAAQAESAPKAPTAPAPKKRGRPAKPTVAESASEPVPPPERPAPSSAKLEALIDTLEPLVAEGHRVLVFSQFVTMLEFIREELVARGIGHLLLTGQTENRQDLVDKFQSAGGPPVFLLSLKAAGSGLNLTAASYVVLFDPWWNPAVEAQAIDRTHRIGQKNTVIAYRLIAKDTIEEKIRALQREKSNLASAVVQEESLAKVMDLESLRRILA